MPALGEIATASRFALVGLLATAVHLAVAGAWLALAPATPELLANLAAFAVAFQVSLVGHRRYSFRQRGDAGKFLAVALGGFALNTGLLGALLAAGPIDGFAAIAISTLTVPVLTYLASRFWAFRAPAA